MPTANTEGDGYSPLDDPVVTVIMPCHNHAHFLPVAVESAITQSYENKRLVIINDGSTDNSLEVAQELANEHKIITVLNNPEPTGPSAARNKGIKYAWDETDFFCMLDADDSYLPGKIEESVKKILPDPDRIGLVYGDVVIYNHATKTSNLELREPYNRERIEQECMISNTPLVSKLALSKVGLYDESMRTAEDWDLWLRITEQFVAVHAPNAMSTYSVTGNNASDTVDQETWNENWDKIRRRIMSQHDIS